jgi:hypothetical protein
MWVVYKNERWNLHNVNHRTLNTIKEYYPDMCYEIERIGSDETLSVPVKDLEVYFNQEVSNPYEPIRNELLG